MRAIQQITRILGIFLALVTLIGIFLPRSFTIERQVEIAATPEEIYPYVSDLENWGLWSPWSDNPEFSITIGTVSSGVGANMSWTGSSPGVLTITQAAPHSGVHYELIFENSANVADIIFNRNSDTTLVTWRLQGRIPTIIVGGYVAILMGAMGGDDLERGLTSLKAVVEAQ